MVEKETVNGKLMFAMRANAVFSATSAIAFIGFADSVASLIGVSSSLWIRVVGFSLSGFAVLLYFVTRPKGEGPHSLIAWGVIAGDFLWVVATIIGLAIWGSLLSASGFNLIIAVAFVVGALATLQWRFLVIRDGFD